MLNKILTVLILFLTSVNVVHADDTALICQDSVDTSYTEFNVGSGETFSDELGQSFTTGNDPLTVTSIAIDINKSVDDVDGLILLRVWKGVESPLPGQEGIYIPDLAFGAIGNVFKDSTTILTSENHFDCDVVTSPESWQTFTFDTPIELEANSKYVFTLRTPSTITSQFHVNVHGTEATDIYTDGMMIVGAQDPGSDDVQFGYLEEIYEADDDTGFIIIGEITSAPSSFGNLEQFIFLFAGMFVVSGVLAMIKTPTTLILAMNSLIVLGGIGMNWLPSYLLIVAMLVVGLILIFTFGSKSGESV